MRYIKTYLNITLHHIIVFNDGNKNKQTKKRRGVAALPEYYLSQVDKNLT